MMQDAVSILTTVLLLWATAPRTASNSGLLGTHGAPTGETRATCALLTQEGTRQVFAVSIRQPPTQ